MTLVNLRKILFLLALGSLLLLAAALALWSLWPAPAPREARIFVVGGHSLQFAPSYLRDADASDPERVDLVVLAPDFAPAAAEPRRLPASGEPEPAGRAQIFLTLTPAPPLEGRAAAASPAERYGPYLSSEATVAEGGLLRRRFDESSPFAGEDLYLAPPDGEEFSARCQRQKIPSDELPSTCLADLRVENILVQMRFDPVWLAQWTNLRANVLKLTRGAISP